MQASANGGDEKRNNHCPEIAVGQRQQPHHNNKSHNIIPNITKYVWRTINATTPCVDAGSLAHCSEGHDGRGHGQGLRRGKGR